MAYLLFLLLLGLVLGFGFYAVLGSSLGSAPLPFPAFGVAKTKRQFNNGWNYKSSTSFYPDQTCYGDSTSGRWKTSCDQNRDFF